MEPVISWNTTCSTCAWNQTPSQFLVLFVFLCNPPRFLPRIFLWSQSPSSYNDIILWMSHLGNAICTCTALWFWDTMEGSQSAYSLCSCEIYQGRLPSLNPSCPDPLLWTHRPQYMCWGFWSSSCNGDGADVPLRLLNKRFLFSMGKWVIIFQSNNSLQ